MILLASALFALLSQSTALAVLQRTFVAPESGRVLYGISVPAGYTKGEPRPLILALHPGGGQGTPYYGLSFMRGIVSPALKDLNAIIVAPDCPTRSWSDPAAEQAVMALLQNVMKSTPSTGAASSSPDSVWAAAARGSCRRATPICSPAPFP